MTQTSLEEKSQPDWEYRGVRLQMTAVPDDEKQDSTHESPSIVDGLTADQEYDLRIAGCELIQLSGQLLKLPQVAMATGQVLFQRFFFNKSLVRHDYEHYAMGCIHLAAKIEECPRRLRDTINVFHHMRQAREQKPFTPLIPDQSYVNLKNQVIKAERRVLKELGFCVHVKHPHKLIICYLQFLGEEKNSHLVQCAWNFMNDSLRTNVFVCYFPETIACACIYLAARQLKIPLPESTTEADCWWNVFRVKESSIRAICYEILRLYSRAKPKTSELESRLAELHEQRRMHLEKRQRQRDAAVITAASMATGASASTNAVQTVPHPAPQHRVGATMLTASNTQVSSESGSGANVGGGGRQTSGNEERSRPHSRERNRKHRSKRGHHERRNRSRSRSRSRSRTPKAYRRGVSRSRSRTPPRRGNKEKMNRAHARRHRGRSISSGSRSPSSERHYRSLRVKKASGPSRRPRSRSDSRSRSRSPAGRMSGVGSRKSGSNNYYSGLSSAVNGRTKIRRN